MSGQGGTLQELAEIRRGAAAQASGKKEETTEVELPSGEANDDVYQEEGQEVEVKAETQEESQEVEAKVEAKTSDEEEEVIRIGDKEFHSQAEAIKYAESLEYEKLTQEAYHRGIHDTIAATRPQEQAPQEEDNFEEKFYTNPKDTLKELKEEAKREAIETIKKEQQREALWNQFCSENPDIRRKDAERILNENWNTFGKMTDLSKAMKLLALKTREEYREIADRLKPRTELPNRQGQVVSTGTGHAPSVTPKKTEARSSNFIAEMKKLKGR